jgi:hypothetical protein
MLDATHARDAAYADVFVTDDKNLYDLLVRSRLPLRLERLNGFARELGLGNP